MNPCPHCKGEGHVFDKFARYNIVLWIWLFFEKDRHGVTRVECPACNGMGYVCER